MLFDLQSEKVNKIIICPILKEVQRIYLQYGYSLEFLYVLFEGLKLNVRKIDNKDNYNTSLRIKNQYLCYGLMLNSRLNRYSYGNNNKEEMKVYEKCKKYLQEKNSKKDFRMISLSFEEALDFLTESELLEHLKWFQNQVEFAMQIVEKYDDGNINRKKKVSTILEEL